jgi:hypothetical protein
MGTEYAVACLECRLFIDLHKWPVIEELGESLAQAYETHEQKIILPEISMNPVVYFNADDGLGVLSRVHEEHLKETSYDQLYIQKLALVLSSFLPAHKDHTLILVSDMGARPWHIGEPVWYEWKEIIAAFDFAAQFLPRNLVDDFSFTAWDQVIAFYEKKEAWFLHDQAKDQLEELKKRFCEYLESGTTEKKE